MKQIEIQVKGQIDQNWSDWFGGLTITHTERDESILTGAVRDQAELRGLLSRITDLGLELILVKVNEISRKNACLNRQFL